MIFKRALSVIAALFHRRHFEQDMETELRNHMEAFADDLVERGLSRAEAEFRARREFGAVQSG